MNIETIKRLCPEYTTAQYRLWQKENRAAYGLLHDLAEARQALSWRPISEAPINKELQFYVPNYTEAGVIQGTLNGDKWVICDADFIEYGSDDYPTHFRYPPTPPSSKAGA